MVRWFPSPSAVTTPMVLATAVAYSTHTRRAYAYSYLVGTICILALVLRIALGRMYDGDNDDHRDVLTVAKFPQIWPVFDDLEPPVPLGCVGGHLNPLQLTVCAFGWGDCRYVRHLCGTCFVGRELLLRKSSSRL